MSVAAFESTEPIASEAVAVVMVVRGEPVFRLQRVIDSLAAQRDVAPFPVVIAAPPDEIARLRAIEPGGAARSISLVHNVGGARSAGLNAAVRAADADIVVRVDARSTLSADHVARCVSRLHSDPLVGVVGGIQQPADSSGSARQRGIARALRNPWLLGNAAYRRPDASGATDTVYLGAFRSRDLLALGGYDERLEANEDYDLCTRYRDGGRVVWLEQGMVVEYEPRDTFRALAAQYRAFGASKVVFWRTTGRGPGGRQRLALACGVAGSLAAVASFRHPRRLVALAALAGAGLAALDHLAEPHERDARVRGMAWVASGVIVSNWLAGIASEGVRGRRWRRPALRDVEHPLQRDAGPLRSLLVDDDLVDDLAAPE
jgi:hypothetical protein